MKDENLRPKDHASKSGLPPLPQRSPTSRRRILIADDDSDILDVLSISLKEQYDITQAADGEEALKSIHHRPPDLVIVDWMMPKMSGYEVCQKLKEDLLLRHLPIIMLTGKGEVKEKIKGLDAGADDYIVKPFEPTELLARVKTVLRRTEIDLDANPLTRLPGNVSIVNEIGKRINEGRLFAVCYIDLDKFKVFNDKYGFERGDELIRETARILIGAIEEKGEAHDFIGHIGGDDFVVITIPKMVDTLCNRIIEDFKVIASRVYDEEDFAKGYLLGKDRQGSPIRTPLVSISMGVVTNEQRTIEHVAQVGQIGAELKSHAKSLEGSNFVKDKRK